MAFQPPAVDEIAQDQPKFTPPAPDDFDITQNIKVSDYDKYKLAVANGATPQDYSELPGMTPANNPDWDIVRQGGAVPFVSKALSTIQEDVIEPVAAQLFTGMKQATAVDVPARPDQQGKGFSALNLAPVEPNKPMLQLPKLSQSEMEAATPTERAVAGVGEGMAGVLEGFSTPGNLALLPFGEVAPVKGYFGLQMAAGVPDSIQALDRAKTPDEKARAWTALTANLGMGMMLAHSAGEAKAKGAAAEAGGTKAQTPLSESHSQLLAPHMTEDGHVFTTLEDGQVMKANHETGQVEVDPQQFAKWVEGDLKDLSPKDKAEAVKSAFEHEDIHLKTDPEDAEPFWDSLSPFEQYTLKRQYLKGQDPAKFTPAQMGFEAIRNRIERAMGMTRSDFVGLALHERWTGQALDHLANIVGKIRGLRDSELSAHQKSILDKVRDNIEAAQNAVAGGVGAATANQPFMLRQEEEPGGDGSELLKRGPGETSVSDFMNLSDGDAQKFFDGNIKRGNPIQNDAVLAGMKMGVDKIPELTKMRDQMHELGMRKLEKAFGPGGDGKAPVEMGKVIWLNGVLEGAARKGPNYESVVTRLREQQGPAMLRKKNKAGEQPEMFGAVTQKGVPGGEDVQAISAGEAGAREFLPELKISPRQVETEQRYQSLPVRAITPSEAKSPAELAKFLTADARVEGSDKPVSVSRRLTAMVNKHDGTVHLVSTYAGDGKARMVDPKLEGKERPNRPIEELLHNYQPIASILLREPVQNFHQKFANLGDFHDRFMDEVTAGMREQGTGRFEGIPMSTSETKFQYPKERESNLPRPVEPELRAFHDFFGDTIPSDRGMFERKLLKSGVMANRQMISGLEKLMNIEQRSNRGMSPGQALSNVLDRLYENITQSATRSDFVKRTMDQSRPTSLAGDPETQAALKRTLAEFDRQKRSGARDLSTLRTKAPTTSQLPPPDVFAEGEGFQIQRPRQDPKPESSPVTKPELLSPEDRDLLNQRIEKEHNIISSERSAHLMHELVTMTAPKERYTVGKSKSVQEGGPKVQEFTDDEVAEPQIEMFKARDVEAEPAPEQSAGESLAAEKKVVAKGEGNKGQLDFWKKQGPAMLRRVDEVQEEAAKAIGVIKAYAERKASEQELSAGRDAADNKFAIAGDQVDKAIRLASADKSMPNGKPEVLKAAPTVVQAGAYTVDYPVPEALKGDLLAKMEADPIWRNIQGLFSSEDPIDKARGGQMLAKLKRETVLQMVDDGDIDWHTGTVKYNKKAVENLDKFGNYLDRAKSQAENILSSKGGGIDGMLNRRAARARLNAVEKMRGQLEYAKDHWNEPELQDTAAKMVMELEQQHRQERDMGMRVKRTENYLPGRYDEQWFDGDRIQFMEGPKILGQNFRKPATFGNYYEAIAAGNYLPFNLDGAALVAHRVRQGMRQVEMRLWENGLKTLKDPQSGLQIVTGLKRDAEGNAITPSPEYTVLTLEDSGRQVAVHKGYRDIVKALTGESVIQDVPATRRAMQFSQKLKHTILFGDTFHLGRLKAYDWSINGIGRGGYKGGLSILEYRPEDVSEAVRKGLVRPEDAAWASEPITVQLPKGTTTVTRRQVANLFLHKGLNVGRIADSIYKVEGMGVIGKYNRWLFDKFTRGLMLETAVKEFERLSADNPKTDYRKLIGDISRDTNNYMGSIGRQGWIKNQTFQDIFRMFGLAPQWVEGLIKKETALPGRLSGLSYLAGRRDVPLLGTAGRGIARGLASMFVMTQVLNLITRRQPTWKNDEEGHKWDAWIPDVTGKSEGFFLSPLSLFNEVTHDIIRLTSNKPTVYDALHQIGENKLGPYGRAAMVLATGETPDHRKVTSTVGMAKEVGKAMIPVPISLSKVAQSGLAMVGIGHPPAPGSVQRQAMASFGVKTEPAPTASNQIYKKADDFVKANGLDRGAGWRQVQTDELGYTDLRQAAATGDQKSFSQALEKLRESRTDEEIYKAMKLWNGRAFTGSKAIEKYFLSNLSDQELDLYSKARLERQKTFSNFENLLIDDLSKSPSATK